MRQVVVKDLVFGSGRMKICVPVCEKTTEAVLDAVKETTTAEIITVVRIRIVMITVEKIGTTRIVVTTAETITVTTAGIITAATDAVRIVRRTVRSR